jgi:5'-3' exonuclease
VDANRNVEAACVETYEADDLIATLTAIAAGEGERVIVFSADKDLHQLLSAGTVTQVRNGETQVSQ